MEKNYKGFWAVVFFVLSFLPKLSNRWKIQWALSVFFMLITIFISVVTPLVLRWLIGLLEISSSPDSFNITMLVLFFYASLWTVGQVTSQVRELVLVRPISSVIRMVSIRVVGHLMKLSMRFHAFKQTGSVIALVKQAQEAVPRIIWGCFFSVIPVFIEIVFATFLITYTFGITYGLVVSIIFFVYILFTFYSAKKILVAQVRYDEKRIAEAGKIGDALLNIETVKYFGNVNLEISRCDQALSFREEAEGDFYNIMELSHLGQALIIGMGMMVTIVLSGYKVVQKEFSVGDFVMINSYLFQLIGPLMTLSRFIREMRKGAANMQGALMLLDTLPEVKEAKNPLVIEDSKVEIEFKSVGFCYFKDVAIFQDLSFFIPSKKMTAIVGNTGAGKSTLTKLLFRFYDVTSGEILVNGQNLKNYALSSISDNFAVVPQSLVLFNDTLRYNLTYSKPDATEEEIWDVISKAQLETFVKNLPHGFDTKVGESGIRLSGGERQRLAIARALLKKPKLFVFDEATSALDTKTEKMIQKSLAEISEDTTTLVIAHRLSTIVSADQIVVLGGGKVLEIGTHGSLLTNPNSVYSKLWNEQFVKDSN